MNFTFHKEATNRFILFPSTGRLVFHPNDLFHPLLPHPQPNPSGGNKKEKEPVLVLTPPRLNQQQREFQSSRYKLKYVVLLIQTL